MSAELIYTQDSFAGGMNQVLLDVKVPANQYIAGVNVRTRFGYAEPVMEPVSVKYNLPDGFFQGLYAFGNIQVVFVSGLGYYKSVGDVVWTQLAGLSLNSGVSRIYAQAVPVASLKYLRFNKEADASPTAGVDFDAAVIGASSIALVCQDGINQPWLVFSDATCRVSHDYAAWTTTDREYVPIGKQMVFWNNVLYIVEPNGKYFYRSVSGRPLDFVIAVDENGEKVADAEVVSHAVDSNEIKLLAPMNDQSLLVITSYQAYGVTRNLDDLLYGEPTFNNTQLFTAGAVNQFSFGDILGDFAFIDREGLKTFNAVQQTKFEGNNSVFSLSIAKMFKGIVQGENACAGSFDNYTFFSVSTTYSPATILVFDNISKVFVSVDLLSTKQIKQIASTYTTNEQRLFAITENDILELYPINSTDPKDAVIFTRALDTRNAEGVTMPGIGNLKTREVRLLFEDSIEDGSVFLNEIVNNSNQNDSYEREIPAVMGGVVYPVTIPVMFTLTNSVVPFNIPMKNAKEGQKLAFAITWTGGAKLTYFAAKADSYFSKSSPQQQSRIPNASR